MTKKEFAEAVRSMKHAGAEMLEERGGEFSFGEWAGESEREIIYRETGLDMDDLEDWRVDELLDAYLGM